MSRPETDRLANGGTSGSRCQAQTGPVWKLGGEACGCELQAEHAGDHECSCGSWWVDSVRRNSVRPEADRPICPECFTVRAVNGECGCVG